MTKVIFVQPDGSQKEVDAENGATLMETAVRNDIVGVIGECGGACTCATCHVYVGADWTERVGPPSMMEEDMLDFAYDIRPSSRLSCQVKISDEFDGLTVEVPKDQG